MLDQLVGEYHLHPIVDHFTIALLTFGIAAEVLAACALLLSRDESGWFSGCAQKLRSASLLLVVAGGCAAVLSYLTGDIEAERLWDTMPPAAQPVLAATGGAGRYLSHAALGHYLMYAFLILAAWRVLIELSPRFARTRTVFLLAGVVAVGALLYQGKTGGDLVYQYGVGTSNRAGFAHSSEHR